MYLPSLVNTRKELYEEEGSRPQDIARYRRERREWDVKWEKEKLGKREARAPAQSARVWERRGAIETARGGEEALQ
jgi:hypothetical protein